MKKYFFAVFFSAVFFSFASAKTEKEVEQEPDTYEYNLLVSAIKGVSSPYVSGDYVVFTAKKNSASVGIAFDFENFKTIHPYFLHKTFDIEGEEVASWFFFVLEKPKGIESISYRLIIDGLWSTDPENPEIRYDKESRLNFSFLKLPKEDDAYTKTLSNGFTQFVCLAPTGQKIRLGGSFTNWDSWIYEMSEVSPGRYEITLPLPPGIYYYAYYTGMTAFVDETNHERGYSADGKVVSCIKVEPKPSQDE